MSEFLASLLSALQIEVGKLVAAAMGGFISLNFFDGSKAADGSVQPLTVLQKWSVVLAGCAMGTYGSTLAIDLLSLGQGKSGAAIALFIGIFGMSIAAALVKSLRAIDFKAIVESWLTKKG